MFSGAMAKIDTTEYNKITPFDVCAPKRQTIPLVLSSPHSGSLYPDEFIANSYLSLDALRKSEDCYVDELFACAPELGAPLIHAKFARAFLDLNREPYELDPSMFSGALPPHINNTSPRVAAGLGTIARIVGTRHEIYRRKLSFTEVEGRINQIYHPYHHALKKLIQETAQTFDLCLLLDCHSMPSTGLPTNFSTSSNRIDIVLGDRTGLSCSSLLTNAIDSFFTDKGYSVVRNNPYAGGFTTEHYGDPANGIHAIQIEINRNIYMDEATLERSLGFKKMRSDIELLIDHMATFAARYREELVFQRLSAE